MTTGSNIMKTRTIGTDLGSIVSRDYFERRPFKADGKTGTVKVELQ
jgi:hypothetical protein